MRKTTERGPSRMAPVLAAVGTGAVMVVLLVTLWLERCLEGAGPETGVIALLVAAAVAVILGVAAAMVQRLREIKGGEWKDAQKY